MKLGPYLLINLVMVGGGIFVYDSLKSDTPGSGPAPAYDPLSADAPASNDEPAPVPMELDGGGNDMLNRDNAKRINALETALAELNKRLAGVRAAGGTASGGVMPTMAGQDLVDAEDPVFDDNTLTTIASYIDEINRRKNEERQKMRITTELERKDIELTDSQRQSIVAETLAYQAKARELLRKQFSRDEAGRNERRQAFQGLQDEFASVIKSLVPEEQAEQVLQSRLGRGMGFFGNFASGGGGDPNRLRRGGRMNR